MKIEDFDWRSAKPAVEDTRIQEIERELDVILPNDYAEVARNYHGTYNPGGVFDYLNSGGNKESRSVGVFYSLGDLNEDEYGDHILLVNQMPRLMPDGLVSFAGDANDGEICFDYRHSKANPSVVIWVQNHPDPNNIFFLANSFTDFIEKMYPDEEA